METDQQHSEFPDEIRCQRNGNEVELTFRIPANLLYFDGHFNQTPILPGVVQLHWAQHYAQREFNPTGEFIGIDALKFQQIVVPEQELVLSLSYQPDKSRVSFTYRSKRGQHASGRIALEEKAS